MMTRTARDVIDGLDVMIVDVSSIHITARIPSLCKTLTITAGDHDRSRYSSRSSSGSRSPPRRRHRLVAESGDPAVPSSASAASASVSVSTTKHNRHISPSRSHRRHHHRRSSSYSPSPTRSRSRGRRSKENEDKVAQAVKAALTAGALEAFRLRKEPGAWSGDKGKRILTAALGAGGIDGFLDRDPRKHEKRHIIESTLAGLAANRLVNGPRSRSRSRRSRSGSPSRRRRHSSGGLKEAAAAGLLAAAGKEVYDHVKSRSRSHGRDRSRSHSRDHRYSSDDGSYDSPPPPRSRKRSKSVSDYINDGLAKMGLGDTGKRSRSRHRSSRRDYDDYDDYSDDNRGRKGYWFCWWDGWSIWDALNDVMMSLWLMNGESNGRLSLVDFLLSMPVFVLWMQLE